MPLSTVTRLIICISFIFFLGGCGVELEEDGGLIGSRVAVEETSNATAAVEGSSNETTAVESTGKGTALVSWTPPTDNTDDSTLTDLAGFKIYYGTFPGEYDQTITINNSGLSSYLVENLASSDWFFVMTAFNSSGIESAYSAEVHKEIDEID
jgi:hypothetical protein